MPRLKPIQALGHITRLAVALLILTTCAVGPDYRKPPVEDITPADWRWKIAEPRDTISRGEWWTVFGDPVLAALEASAVAANQDLRAAVARVDEARSAARIDRSEFFPEISLDPSVKRERTSGHMPTPIPIPIPASHVNTYSVPFDLSYEVDVWGRVRRSFEAAQAQAEASVSDYWSVLLTLTADVAANYFHVRALDAEIAVLQQTIQSREEMVRVLEGRFLAGAVPEIDVARARTELAGARADLADARRQRAETLHALALLCGKPAGDFELAERPLAGSPPQVPPGLPSSLLERRPDIARAERTLAAKNAQIGVAKAAYFPVISLTGQAGYLSAEVNELFADSTRVWSISPGLSLPLFTGGRTQARVRQAEAIFRESVAAYRQTILTAFKEVEDSLAQLVLRGEESVAQMEAVTAAQRSVELARARYEAGNGSYLDLLDTDRARLQQERKLAQAAGRRFEAAVHLIKALGGGWEGGT